jgi:hypothetical protein
MKKKLKLTIDKDIKEEAKIAAKRIGVSISELVEQYLKTVSMETDDWKPREGSIVSKISGSVRIHDTGGVYSDIDTDALIENYGYEKNSDR